jgi:hypothetical protein
VDELSLDDAPPCAICLKPIQTTVVRVMMWANDHPETLVREDATEDEAELVFVHRDCFLPVMHRDYSI